MRLLRNWTLLFCAALAGGAAHAQTLPLAPATFGGSTDIGKTLPGGVQRGPAADEFRIRGGGADMWGTGDAFHFNWVQLVGDAALSAEIHFPAGTAPLAKAVLLFRQSLTPDAAYADVAIHGDGHITLQYRPQNGAETRDVTAQPTGSSTIRIVRSGDVFSAYTQLPDGTWKQFASQKVTLKDPVFVGLGVCSHNADGLVTATFTHVTLRHKAQMLPVGQ